MKPEDIAPKPKKRPVSKRKVFSVPNLKDELQIKPAHLSVSKQPPKVSEDKPKTPKQNKKKKEAAKLLPPTKNSKENIEDYQWLIKKNLVRILGTEKKKTTTKQDATKDKTKLKKAKEAAATRRAVTASPVRQKNSKLTSTMHGSDYFWKKKGAPAMILHPNVREVKPAMNKPKNIVNVLESLKAKGDKVEQKAKKPKNISEKVNKTSAPKEDKKKPKKKKETVQQMFEEVVKS